MKKSPWLILAYQLPSRPSNIRVKIWRKLQALGAVPVKNSIYALPDNPDAREDFEWLRKEILQMKGEASLFSAGSLSAQEDREIIESFQRIRGEDFTRFSEGMADLEDRIKGLLQGGHVKPESAGRLAREWEKRQEEWERLVKIDFFQAPNRRRAEKTVASVKGLVERVKSVSLHQSPQELPPVDREMLKGRVWVTRKDPHIDRLACAWLIRRFIDPKARFKFVAEPYKPRGKREIRFDMYEAEFTHFGDWCTFETLAHRLGLKDPALNQVAEIVHDIDLKDGKFSRLEASGVALSVAGLCAVRAGDRERMEAGISYFDGLHETLKRAAR